jgi:hypothetical protein
MESEDSLHPSRSRRHCLQWKRKDYERWRNDDALHAVRYLSLVFLRTKYQHR